jgi:thymidylate synthase (FAD)
VRLRPPVSVELLRYDRDCVSLVAAAARMTVSRREVSELLSMGEGEILTWIRELVRRGHGSPLEHCSYSFLVECSRTCTHQLVRHRIASYTQQSMRYSEGYARTAVLALCSKLGIECPEKPGGDYAVYLKALNEAEKLHVEDLAEALSQGFVIPPALLGDSKRLVSYLHGVLAGLRSYYQLLASGVAREDARYVLPHSVRTRIVVTMNARELLEVFLPLRMCSRAQWELRMVAWAIRDHLVKLHPQIFSYAGPRCVLMDARTRGSELCSLEDYLEGRCSFAIDRCPELVPRTAIPACLRSSRIVVGFS